MRLKTLRAAIAMVLVLSLVAGPFWAPPLVRACGPFFESAVFTDVYGPDSPMEEYVAGRLGVLQPRFPRSYLFAAYRNLSGRPFNSEEQSAYLRRGEMPPEASAHEAPTGASRPAKDWVRAWSEKRAAALNEKGNATRPILWANEFGALPRKNGQRASLQGVEIGVCHGPRCRVVTGTAKASRKQWL